MAVGEERRPSLLIDGAVLVTGEVERVTGFERGLPGSEARAGDGWEPDPWIRDDQAVVAHVRDRGLVVLSGCSHAGAINVLRAAQRLTGVERIHAFVGGMHLSGPAFEPLIRADPRRARRDRPRVARAPCHCTGWRATHELARRRARRLRPDERRHAPALRCSRPLKPRTRGETPCRST